MKSTRGAARSRSARYRLDTLREFVIVPIIYLGPLVVGGAPLLFLYWLYRPTVLTNPGLSALKAPAAMAVLLPPTRPESHEAIGTSSQDALSSLADDFEEPRPADKKPKSRPGSGGSHPTIGRRNLRFAGDARRPAPAHNVSAAVANPRQYTGMSMGPASAYAYAAEQSGRQRW